MGKDAVEERERKKRSDVRRRSTGIASWMDAEPTLVVRAISEAAATGGALRFGYSRDGGAFAVGVYGDGEPYTDFISCNENIDETLKYYIELFSSDDDTQASTQKAPKGPKRSPHSVARPN